MSDLAIGGPLGEIGFGPRAAFPRQTPAKPETAPAIPEPKPRVTTPEMTVDEDTPAGPPPAFKITQLQKDLKLQSAQSVMAQFNAAQTFGHVAEARQQAEQAKEVDAKPAEDTQSEALPGETGQSGEAETPAPAPPEAAPPVFPRAEAPAASAPSGPASPPEQPAVQQPSTGLGTPASTVANPMSLGESA